MDPLSKLLHRQGGSRRRSGTAPELRENSKPWRPQAIQRQGGPGSHASLHCDSVPVQPAEPPQQRPLCLPWAPPHAPPLKGPSSAESHCEAPQRKKGEAGPRLLAAAGQCIMCGAALRLHQGIFPAHLVQVQMPSTSLCRPSSIRCSHDIVQGLQCTRQDVLQGNMSSSVHS